MKYSFILLCQLLFLASYSQREEVFKVAAKNTYALAPDIDTLIASSTYNFLLLGSKQPEIVEAKFADGKANIDTGGLHLSVNPITSTGKRTLLQIFAFRNNNKELRLEKLFYIVSQPQPPVFPAPAASTNICWDDFPLTGNDTLPRKALTGLHSLWITRVKPKGLNEVEVAVYKKPVIDTNQIVRQNTITNGDYTSDGFKIVSFKMRLPGKLEIRIRGRSTAVGMSSTGNRTTPQMNKLFSKIKPGRRVILYDVHYVLTQSPSIEQVAGPYNIYVRD